MSWEVGAQEGKLKNSAEFYKKLESLDGELTEDDAIYWLGVFLRENISFSAKMITGLRLYPFQHIAIKSMMNVDYFLGVWGRGYSKSMSAAIFAVMHAIMNPGVQIGILSSSFRQSKNIIQKILEQARRPEAAILNDCITGRRLMTDQWMLEVGQSTIIALPLGDGAKLRGFRFQCIIIDEFLLMPKKIFTEVIVPFLSVAKNPTEREDQRLAENDLIQKGIITEEQRYVWPNNKLICLSSASYQFEYLYEVYKIYEQLILNPEEAKKIKEEDRGQDGATRAILKFSYEFAPPDLYDKSVLQQAEQTMSQAQIDREYRSLFTSDSDGFYKISKLNDVTLKGDDPQCSEIRGDPTARYILSVDPSWSKSEESDDFAMAVFKINEEKKIITMVHGYAMPGSSLKSHIDYMIYLMENFNIVFICGDYNGGVQFFEAFNESEAVKTRGMKMKTIDGLGFDDSEKYTEEIQTLKKAYNLSDRKICFLKFPTSQWIRYANENLAANIDNRKIWFANNPQNVEHIYRQSVDLKLNIEHLKFSRLESGELVGDKGASKIVDLVENAHDIINLTKTQTALIKVSSSAQGNQTFDLPAELKKTTGVNKNRKDSYSALLLGNFGAKLFLDMEKYEGKPVANTFIPFFVGN